MLDTIHAERQDVTAGPILAALYNPHGCRKLISHCPAIVQPSRDRYSASPDASTILEKVEKGTKDRSSVIQIVSEFVVKEEARGQFELAYGPGGAWSKLFGGCPGFRGTTLVRDTENRQRYLTIDFWDTLAQREESLTGRTAEYSRLIDFFAEWTESSTEVGIFRVQAEATVRPRARAKRRGAREAHRRNRRPTR